MIFKYLTFLTLLTSLLSSALEAYRDLEAEINDFVLETKQIEIADYLHVFNPSITRWKGELWLCFRYYDPETLTTDGMAFAKLDKNFNVIGKPLPLIRLFEPCNFPSRGQDPRVVTVGDDLYVVYNNFVDTDAGENRRMFIAKLFNTGFAFFSSHYQVITSFDNEIPFQKEKNWVPFVYENQLLLSYSLNPHQVVVSPNANSRSAVTIASTKKQINWKWGKLLGGTNALKINDKYLAFFHSVKSEVTVHSKGKSIPHYFMGAYLFEDEPPFEITKVSPKPIIGPKFYHGKEYKTWKPLRVVFPGGFVFDEKFVWVVYGRQDHESWVVKLDKQKLLNSLLATQDE